jgi:hypothetical protein
MERALSLGASRAQWVHLYGLVQSLSYLVRLNDFKTAQRIRARLAWVLRKPSDLPKARRDELDELFEISGQWVRNTGRDQWPMGAQHRRPSRL